MNRWIHCSEITNIKVSPAKNYGRVITDLQLLLKLMVCTKKMLYKNH
jgi:hypothetical protein